MKKSNASSFIVGVIMLVASISGLSSLIGHKINAISNQLPIDSTFMVVSADRAVAGAFSSPDSYAFLYVPTTLATSNIEVNSIRNGELSSFVVTTKISGTCTTNEVNSFRSSGGFSNARSLSIDNNAFTTDTFTGDIGSGSVVFKVYCVRVSTSTTVGVGSYSNVVFKLDSSSGTLLGSYPGPATNKGTGYFANSGDKWSMKLEFATPCGRDISSLGNSIQLYDLDNQYSQNPNISVWLLSYNRNTGAYNGSVKLDEDDPSDVTFSRTVSGEDRYLTDGGNFSPYNNNYTWDVQPDNEVYDSDVRYELNISGIGRNNKIRVRLPFDQIYSSVKCPTIPVKNPAPICGSHSPVSVEAGKNFDLTLGITNPSTSVDTNYDLKTSVDGSNYSQRISIKAGSSGSAVFNIPALDVGVYDFTWTYTDGTFGPGATAPNPDIPACVGKITVSDMYVAKFFGAEVQAGSNFGPGCSPNPAAKVLGFIRNVSGSDYIGTSSQLGAFSQNTIEGVHTNGQFAPAPSINRLAFSNSGLPPTNTSIGGSFGSALPCARNYYADRLLNTAPAGSSNLSTLASGRYTIGSGPNTTVQVNTGAGLADGRQIVVYVNGNVHINGGGTTFGFASNSWSSINQIPSLYIIASGNIYVNSSINKIDAVLVAQANANVNTGEIFTCSNGTDILRPSINEGFISGSCKNRLEVNGSLIAEKVHLLRAVGSLNSSSTLTRSEIATDPSTWSNNAEVLRYSPELFINRNSYLLPTNNTGISYDSITSLAPAF